MQNNLNDLLDLNIVSQSNDIFVGSNFCNSSRDLTIFQQNVRSLRKNFDTLCGYLVNCFTKLPHIVVLTEMSIVLC